MEIIEIGKEFQKEEKLNRGQQMEKMVKTYFGKEYQLDSNDHRTSSDLEINGKNISIKSANCSLVNYKIATNLEEAVNQYLMEDYSNYYLYMVERQKMVIGYLMNKEEFGRFCKANAEITSDKKLRIRKADNKINMYVALNF